MGNTWSRNINAVHSIFMTNLYNQLWLRSGLLSVFLSPMFLYIWAATHGPFFLHKASFGHLPWGRSWSLPWSTQAATISCQVWCNVLSNSNSYFRYLLFLITSLLILPTEVSIQRSLSPTITQWLPFPYRLLQMSFNANIIPNAPYWFGLSHLFLLHLSN